ncbi:MAG: hypothetical protein DRO00_02270 [Thermoproteota archaeon]|nr:MAG: hypothetical protein DRO00_02270 [Candidatus Korarchaeota archaeon]
MNIGYFVLFALYTAVACVPFILGYLEYKKPVDPGPLFINLDRVVTDRNEALILRERVKPAIEVGIITKERDMEDLSPEKVLREKPKFHPELGYFRLVYGDTFIPDQTSIKDLLIVIGNLRLGNRCKILGGAYATGEIRVGSECVIRFLASDSDVYLGQNTLVDRWIDAKGKIVISRDCKIAKVTSDSIIEAVECCEVKEVCAVRGFEICDPSKKPLELEGS